MAEIRKRLAVSFAAVVMLLIAGTTGYFVLGGGKWSLIECLYMTLVTVTTLGLESLEGWEYTDGVRIFTAILLVLGIGTFLYFVSNLTALILEADLQQVFRTRRMQKNIAALQDHIIVCGVGTTGVHVVEEMLATGTPFVALDTDKERLEDLREQAPEGAFLFVEGDATEDEALQEAGIERARGLVSALPTDKDNLFVVITAREANPQVRIVSKGVELRAADKLRKGGADSVVSTNYIGGTRLASEVLRPHVMQFLDEMLRERDKNLRIEEVEIPSSSPLAGRALRAAGIRDHTEVLVLAVRNRQEGTYAYNPGPNTQLEAGTTLIVLGPTDSMPKLRQGIATGFK